MLHDQDKKCLDDSIMVDTSNGPSHGSAVVGVTARIMNVAPDSSESMLRVSAIHLMLKRLKPSNVYRPFRYRDVA